MPEVQDRPKKGFSLNATLIVQKAEKSKPIGIDAAVSLAILAVGLPAGTINIKASANPDAGNNPSSTAKQVTVAVNAALDDVVPKVIKAMEAKAKPSP